LFAPAYPSYNDGTADIFNVIVTEASARYGIYVSGPTITLENLFVLGATRGFYTYYATNPITFKNLYVRGVTTLTLLYNLHNHVYGINIDSDNWLMYWLGTNNGYRFYRQYEFSLNVTTESGVPISNANVTVYNAVEGKVFSVLTGANGSFATKTLTMGFYNQTGGNTLYDYNPYNITITHPSYQTKTFNFTLDAPINWIITLEPRKAGFTIGLGGGLILGLTIMGILALTGIYYQKSR